MGQNASREAFAIDLPSGIRADRDWKFWSSCSVNGRVVAVPKCAEKILVVDPTFTEQLDKNSSSLSALIPDFKSMAKASRDLARLLP